MNNHVMPPDTWTAAFAGGLLMGVIHVVTGADHLSAVATLSCGNDRCTATVLGSAMGRQALRRVARRVPRRARGERNRPRSVRGWKNTHGNRGRAPDARGSGRTVCGTRARRDGGAEDTRRRGGYRALDDPEQGDGVKRALFRDPDDENEEESGVRRSGGRGGGGTSRRHVAVRGGEEPSARRPRRRGSKRPCWCSPRWPCVVRRSCSDTSPASASRRWRRWAPSRRRTARSPAGSATRTARGCGPSCDASAPGRVSRLRRGGWIALSASGRGRGPRAV